MYNILIITSARLIIDPYQLFVRYCGTYRQYVVVDEMINFYPEPFSTPSSFQDILTFVDGQRMNGNVEGKEVVINNTTYYRHTYQTKEEMWAAYLSNPRKDFSKGKGLAHAKVDFLFDHILENGFTPLRGSLVDLAAFTTVVLFDGTADLVFGKDKRVLPLSGKRYNSDITFHRFDIPLRRKNGGDWSKEQLDYALPNLLQILKNTTGKTLIVTWKTLDTFPQNNGSADEMENLPPVKYRFPQMVKDWLRQKGIPPSDFEVIYRGCGEDRGSNAFRDYENIVFLGEWRIPDNVVADINSMFGCSCKFEDYKLALLVQTICRLRIRQHQGLPINVYFSDDIDYNLMYQAQEYFKDNSPSTCDIQGVFHPCPKYSVVDKKNFVGLASLMSFDPKIKQAIILGTAYSFSITLNDLYTLIPKDRKARSRYQRFSSFLKRRKLNMTITR